MYTSGRCRAGREPTPEATGIEPAGHKVTMDFIESCHTLGVKPSDSPEEIARAYRDLVRVWHPDRFASTPRLQQKAGEKLRLINEAYGEILTHLDKGKHPAEKPGTPPKSTKRHSPTPSSLEINGLWPRLAARFFDYVLWASVLAISGALSLFPDLGIEFISVPMLIVFTWIFPESLLLWTTGTTPGKWLFSLRILPPGGIGFFRAVKRSISVWCHGMAIGIPFLLPVTFAMAFRTLSRSKAAIWDGDSGTRVNTGVPSLKKKAAAGICFIALLTISVTVYDFRRPAPGPAENYNVRSPPVASSDKESAHGKTSRYDREIETLYGFRDVHPEDPVVHMDLGAILLRAGRIEEAVEAYYSLTALTPDDPEAHYLLGNALVKAGEPEAAVESLSRCLELAPRHTKARHRLGLGYVALGRPLDAAGQYRVLLKLDRELADELFDLIMLAFGAVAL